MCMAVPGRVVGIAERDGTSFAVVEFRGGSQEVSLVCVPEAEVGDYVVVHAGFAVGRIDEDSAQETLTLLERLDELEAGDTRTPVPRSPGVRRSPPPSP